MVRDWLKGEELWCIEPAVDIMSMRTYAHSVPCALIRIKLNT